MLVFENDNAVLEYCKILLLGFEVELSEDLPASEEMMRSLRISAEEFLHKKAGSLTLLCTPFIPGD